MKKFTPAQFEPLMTQKWHEEQVYKTPEAGKNGKMYTLVMFPYPSGAGLHVGHARVYTGTDVLARFARMNGYAVLNPMGWDAFGLPAENAAIKEKKNPMDIVPRNIATFKGQMIKLGLSFDWDREFSTTDPKYYKWTQYLFIELFKMGLLYKKMTPVYFCEFCKTGLAEEEVLPNGTHERCGNRIVRRELPQWMFRITSYGDRLLEELEGLDWPSGILQMQRNWIGKQKGLNIDFKIDDSPETLTVWTKFWETIFGVTFLVVAPEHPWIQSMIKDDHASADVKEYVNVALSKSDEQRLKEEKDKTGVFTGHYAINPVNGQKVPVWVADYVLSTVGTGAVMGVPAHDDRDFAFAKKYNLPVLQVVRYEDADTNDRVSRAEISFEGEGHLMNSAQFDGKAAWKDGKSEMAAWMIEQGYAAWKTTYHLRDWIFSRQRYWGEPIPMVYCEACAAQKKSWWDTEAGMHALHEQGEKLDKTVDQNIRNNIKIVQEGMYGWFPIDQKTLPLELPKIDSYEPTDTGESPLAAIPEWVKATCPNCGGPARRETDTMPNWAGSCWYFLRFADPHNEMEPWSAEAMKTWEPVDWYIGGAEHAVLHLLYARFWVKALQDLKMLDFNEPFKRLRNVGMVLATDHHKMSKSQGNVINPDDVIGEFGADTLRVYEMFMAPFNQEIAWSTAALQGAYRFLGRIWNIYHHSEYIVKEVSHEDKKLAVSLQKTIVKITNDLTSVKFNTSIAAMMEFLNEWETFGAKDEKALHHFRKLSRDHAKAFLQILAPFAPFMTDYLWREIMGETSSIHLSHWPEVDPAAIHEDEVTIPVQVNGKTRAVITVPVSEIERDKIIPHAEANASVKNHIQGKIYEAVYVRGRILNFVLKD